MGRADFARYAPKPRLQRDLERLAYGIRALRITHNLIHARPIERGTMPIEIKGLGDGVQRARDAIRRAREATGDMAESVNRLVQTANEIAESCDKHRSDLEFEATQLGNSPPASNGLDAPEKPFQQPGAGNSAVNGSSG